MSATARVIRLEIADETVSVKDIDTLIDVMEKRIPHKEVMTAEEAAPFVRLSVRRLNELCSQGKIPYHRLYDSGVRLFLRSELLDHIKKH